MVKTLKKISTFFHFEDKETETLIGHQLNWQRQSKNPALSFVFISPEGTPALSKPLLRRQRWAAKFYTNRL